MSWRGMEVIGDVDPNDSFNWGISIVKVRWYSDIDKVAATLQANPAVKVVTRFWGPDYGSCQQDGCDFNGGCITADANNWYNKLNQYGAVGKWWGHIPVNEPNKCMTSSQFQTNMQNLTGGIDWWHGQTHILVPWVTPPLAAYGTGPTGEDEGTYIQALINSGVLSSNYSDGSGAIWRYVGAHNYWNNCSQMQDRYGYFTYWYVGQLARPHGKQALVDEVNSNPPCAGGQYGGYGDAGRLTDLYRYMGEVEANDGSDVLMNIVFAHTSDTSGCNGQGWHQFDYTQSQWNTIASGKTCPYSCSQGCS